MSAVSVSGLTKSFDLSSSRLRVCAVQDLSLEIEEGTIFGLLGPNGSGKSTTIKAILGLLTPDQGRCFVFGRSSGESTSRSEVGYLPEGPYFYKYLSGLELLVYLGQLGGLSRSEARLKGRGLLERVGLGDAIDRRIGGYSKGMLQRVGLAQALINDPRLLILDEPTAGVDPVGAADITRLIQEFKEEGRTILLCSHLLSQVEQVCDEVAILNKGRVIVSGSIEELLEKKEESYRVSGVDASSIEKLRETVESMGGEMNAVKGRKTLEELFMEQLESKESKEV